MRQVPTLCSHDEPGKARQSMAVVCVPRLCEGHSRDRVIVIAPATNQYCDADRHSALGQSVGNGRLIITSVRDRCR
jgi:hypothetical protein